MNSCKRRLSCPQTILQLYDAIVFVRQQKQVPTLDRIANYMRRNHDTSTGDVERQLTLAARDELLHRSKRVGYKGSKVGVEQESFRMPNGDVVKDGHDWYCFHCHRVGEVILCSTCHRVYHPFCVEEDEPHSSKFTCPICKMLKAEMSLKLRKKSLNTLLTYACNRLKEKVSGRDHNACLAWVPPPSTVQPSSSADTVVNTKQIPRDLPADPSQPDESWRYQYFIYQPMDLVTIEKKAHDKKYRRIEEFQADVQCIVHNVVIYYGVHSSMADIARQMLRDCVYDLGEIRQCKDCYRMSNEKTDKFWFCQPCKVKVSRGISCGLWSIFDFRVRDAHPVYDMYPPHELVYAKQKGFPYWPAKVIRRDDDIYDVRFFGGYHQRAKIEQSHIKPINVSLLSLGVKRTVSWNRALEEMKRHQELVGRVNKMQTVTKSSSDEESEHEHEQEEPPVKQIHLESEVETDTEASHAETSISSSSKSAKLIKQAPTPDDFNVVSSSCQEATSARVTTSTQTYRGQFARGVQTELELACSTKAEGRSGRVTKEVRERVEAELRIKFEEEKQKAVDTAVLRVQKEMEKMRELTEQTCEERHSQEMKLVLERHRQALSETKKKQWCYNCEAEAMYHCCWNTSYCSTECQQVHWQMEHKRNCRRKR